MRPRASSRRAAASVEAEPAENSGQPSIANPSPNARSIPGARSSACSAASMTMVPAPHIGSTSGTLGSQPASARRPAASVSRSGAAPISTRAPRRCSRSPEASTLKVKSSSRPRTRIDTSAASSSFATCTPFTASPIASAAVSTIAPVW